MMCPKCRVRMSIFYNGLGCHKCFGVFLLRRRDGLVVASSCFSCGRWINKRNFMGRFRIFCPECATAVTRVRTALYVHAHEDMVRARRRRYKLSHPDAGKVYYRKYALRQKRYVARLFDDVIKHPRDYLEVVK